MDDTLKQQLEFLTRIDRMKTIERQNWTIDLQRREDDASHSWHCAMMALTLQPYAKPTVDMDRAVRMLLIHDLVEIYAGDTPCYDRDVVATQKIREQQAAEKLQNSLPQAQAEDYRALWTEFEDKATDTARYAAAIDRLQPLMLNYFTDGASWRNRTVSAEQVLTRNAITKEELPALWPLVEQAVQTCVEKGLLTLPEK